jgi:hypothetical protein
MPRKKPTGKPLLLRVMAELGKGRISEGYIADDNMDTDGCCDGRHIHINPAHQTVDTVLHECLHRAYPAWPETYVRNRTTYLRKRLTDAEVQAVYQVYNDVKRSRKRALNLAGRE